MKHPKQGLGVMWLMYRCDALAEFQETVDNSRAQAKACDFLISKQRKDGGWAESYLSSQTKVHTPWPFGSCTFWTLTTSLNCLVGSAYIVFSNAAIDYIDVFTVQ